jgi:DNA (cytosine-5)-methyltransferase 1
MGQIRTLDLFSGIGGFALGLERAGMQTVAFCENDAFCQKVLKKHWPSIHIHENIEELDGRQYKGTTQLVCGGFPCQPYSVCGEQRGADDDRALWPEMFRVIRAVEPTWVFLENVTGIIGMELDNVLSDLASESFASQSFIIPACATDAPHRRFRVFIVGRKAVTNSNGTGQQSGSRCRESHREERDNLGRVCEDVADTLSEGLEGYPWHVTRGDKSRRLNKIEGRPTAETGLRAGKPRRWLPEPGVGRVAHGIPRRLDRLRSLGNAVVPQIIEVIGRTIMETDKR